MTPGKLIFFCGKMGAGKSTYAEKVAKDSQAVFLSEDIWLAGLYPGKIQSLKDYARHAGFLKHQMKGLVQSILQNGTDVIMDFPANTKEQRAWFRDIFEAVNAPHLLIHIDVADDICLARLGQRRTDQPERAETDTEEMFRRVTHYFMEPQPDEGFNISRVSP